MAFNPKPSRRKTMNIPEWANPGNWSPQTQNAAKDVLKAVALLVLTVVAKDTSMGKKVCESVKHLPQL
jgi:hypothetical protein